MSRPIAPLHSMDIPHVSAVELPLNVRNTDKAISMIGGTEKIKQVINSNNKAGNTYNHTSIENTLELRLRKDPFHHPIQSSYNTSEKVLLKVSIPAKSIPEDYEQDPSKYSIRELIECNAANNETSNHRVKPVAIIDKTYLFKSIADFQISTKNNTTVQDFNKSVLNFKGYDDVQKYFDENQTMVGISDYKDLDYYTNIDHQLPPPPILSPIRFPFDYRYQKNPFTTAVKDVESGEIKVISTKNSIKLHTKMIDYNTNIVPTEPAKELLVNLDRMDSTRQQVNSPDFSLLKCIEWLRQVFEIKPIWLRKQLEDIVPWDIKKFIKQALPYVTFIYRSGPWRFCNVKFGVDPKSNEKFWTYQSEYFRISGLKFVLPSREVQRIVPNTVQDSPTIPGPLLGGKISVSEYLFFNGTTLPSTVTYQIGDILDVDITTIIQDHQRRMGSDFLREKPDFQDGWINRQSMEVIRRIVRYKLNRILKELPIEESTIYKIIERDYTTDGEAKKDKSEENDEDDDEEFDDEIIAEEEDGENVNDEDIEDEMGSAGVEDSEGSDTTDGIDEYEGTLRKLTLINPVAAKKLEGLVGFIKQDSIDS